MSHDRDQVAKDERLSAIYREIADERVPEELNSRILRMAADKRSMDRESSLWPGWLKPLTVAATIGLSLAIVLEISQTDLQRIEDAATISAPAISAESDVGVQEAAEKSVRDDFIPKDRTAFDAVAEQARNRVGPNQELRIETGDLDAESDASRGQQDYAPVAIERAPVAFEQAPGIAAMPKPSVDTTSDRKELRQSDSPCTSEKATADTWWACIQSLRDAGDFNQADLELQQLKTRYPTFQPEK